MHPLLAQLLGLADPSGADTLPVAADHADMNDMPYEDADGDITYSTPTGTPGQMAANPAQATQPPPPAAEARGEGVTDGLGMAGKKRPSASALALMGR